MDWTEEHYNQILGFDVAWNVSKVEVNEEEEMVFVHVECLEGDLFCGECGALAPIHDHRKVRRWRHLPVMQYDCFIQARPPRVKCPDCNAVKSAELPWADARDRHTTRFEAHAVEVLKAAKSIADGRKLLGISWKAAHRILKKVVERGLERRDVLRSPVEFLSLDEKQYRRGQQYITVLSDPAGGRVLDIAEGRGKEQTEELLLKSLDYGQAMGVLAVSMDMWKGYRSAVELILPGADIVYDKYHVSALLNRAVDQVRRAENKALSATGVLKGTRYLWLKTGLADWQQVKVKRFVAMGLKVARSWAIKEAFRRFWGYSVAGWARRFFKTWYHWARCSRLEPVRKVARTIRDHLDGIMNYFKHRISNGFAESMNSRINALKANAKGFRKFENLRIAVLFHFGKLDLSPTRPHTICR